MEKKHEKRNNWWIFGMRVGLCRRTLSLGIDEIRIHLSGPGCQNRLNLRLGLWPSFIPVSLQDQVISNGRNIHNFYMDTMRLFPH